MNFLSTMSMAALFACGSTAMAGMVVDLAPSQTASGLSGIMNTEMSELIGTIESDKYLDFSIFSNAEGGSSSLLYQGTLMTRVVRSNQSGNLHFNYRILDPNTELSGMISHIEVTGFEGFQTRVEFRSDSPSAGLEGPVMAHRSSAGSMLDFTFDGGLDTGASRFFFAMLDTDTFYEDAALATIYLQSGESVSLVVDGASRAVPAPATLGLLSVAGLFSSRRRRGAS